jgi:hypothetical protein
MQEAESGQEAYVRLRREHEKLRNELSQLVRRASIFYLSLL